MEMVQCGSYKTAKRRCPEAVVIAKCEGGFIAFTSYDAYRIWKGQK